MLNRHTKPVILISMMVLAMIFALVTVWAMPGGRAFRADKKEKTVVDFDDLQLEVPADASDEVLSVEYGSPDLNGIRLPYGFKLAGKVYRFGPHGMKFKANKALKALLKIKAEDVPSGIDAGAIRLFYINREAGRLERVPEQSNDGNGNLRVKLEHFSEYVPGISASWNGDGIVPYMDYVHSGIEHMNMKTLNRNVVFPIYSIKARGMDVNFTACFTENVIDNFDPFFIWKGFHWDFPHAYNGKLYLPGGASYNLDTPQTSLAVTVERYIGNQMCQLSYNSMQLSGIVFKDGSRLTGSFGSGSDTQTYYDANGNWIRYKFTAYRYDTYNTFSRITSLEDSAGHKFYFYYNTGSNFSSLDAGLYKLEQEVPGYPNNRKTILSIQENAFTDALGRTTSFSLDSVIYPNGVRSRYEGVYYNEGSRSFRHYWYKPGESDPYRTEQYVTEEQNFNGTPIITKVTYTDGVRRKIYDYTDETSDSSTITEKEDTYDFQNGTVGKLKKRVKTNYHYCSGYDEYKVPLQVTTYLAKKDGTLGQASVYQYEYDHDFNVTRIVDPNGTETRMAYANTDSDPNLRDFTPPYTAKLPLTVSTSGWKLSGTSDSYKLISVFAANEKNGTKTASSTIKIGSLGGQISFYYSVVGMQNWTYNTFNFYVDGHLSTYMTEYTGSTYSYTCTLAAGTHTLKWTFDRNGLNDYANSYATTCTVSNLIITEKRTPVNQFQNYRFGTVTTVGHDRLLTKATFIKDPVHNTTQLRQTHYKYDADGNLIQSSEAYNGSFIDTYYTYDTYGNVLSKTDGNGNQLQFEYTANPNTGSPAVYLSKVKRADGTVVATYDEFDPALGKPRKVTDPNGNIYRYTYDALGRLLEEKLDDSSAGITRQLDYDDLHNQVTMRFGNGSNWQVGLFTFDPIFGKLLKIERQRDGGTWQLIKENHFDVDGRVTWSQDNMKHKVQHDYDSLDREIQTTSPTGNVTKYDWDERTLTITDANNHQQVKKFDLLYRLKTVMEYPKAGETITTAYQYDNYFDSEAKEPHSNLVSMTNGQGAVTSYTYDNLGRLLQVDYPQDGTNPLAPEVYTYDNVGNLLTKTSARGTKSIEYEFFAGYRAKQITEPNGRVVVNTYDPNDNLLTQTSPGAVYNYIYNPRNQVKNLTARLDGNTFAFSYDYDGFCRLTTIHYPGRIQPVEYDYDDLDRLDVIPDFVTKCSYDGDSKLTKMALANGLNNTYSYDGEDRPDIIKAGNMGDLVDLEYAYDPVGNVTKINGDIYEYDGLNRLTWAGNLPSVDVMNGKAWGRGAAWAYDAAGNMTSRSDYADGQMRKNTAFTCDLANRLWSMGSTNYGNDAAGARTGKNDGTHSWTYTYDGESRMVQVAKDGSVVEDNIYDGCGMRVKKVNNGKTTYYVYSGASPILEYSANDGKYTYYIFAGDKSIAEEKDGKKVFYHRDHLGSTRALTDQDGKLVGLCKYGPWGNLESTNEYDEGVLNGNFELLTNEGVVRNWMSINDSLISNDCSYDSTGGINGSAALRINRQSGNAMTCWARKNLFVSPDTDYVLSGYFLSANAETSKAKAQIVYYDKDGGIIRIDDSGALGYSGTWKEFTLSSHSPADAATMEIRLTTEDAQGASVIFDGIRLKVPGLEGKYDFTGKRQDEGTGDGEGTGLTYFGARFYDSQSCRFMTMDPAKDGWNWYRYCNNNPLMFLDNSGRKAMTMKTFTFSYTFAKGEGLTEKTMRGFISVLNGFGNWATNFVKGFIGYENCAYDRMLGPVGVGFETFGIVAYAGHTLTQTTQIRGNFDDKGKLKSFTVVTEWSYCDENGEFTKRGRIPLEFYQEMCPVHEQKEWVAHNPDNPQDIVCCADFMSLLGDLGASYASATEAFCNNVAANIANGPSYSNDNPGSSKGNTGGSGPC